MLHNDLGPDLYENIVYHAKENLKSDMFLPRIITDRRDSIKDM